MWSEQTNNSPNDQQVSSLLPCVVSTICCSVVSAEWSVRTVCKCSILSAWSSIVGFRLASSVDRLLMRSSSCQKNIWVSVISRGGLKILILYIYKIINITMGKYFNESKSPASNPYLTFTFSIISKNTHSTLQYSTCHSLSIPSNVFGWILLLHQ